MDSLALKEKGNEEFKKENFRGAIEYYTQAIVSNMQQVSNDANILHSNRAQCYRKLNMWKECYEDALTAIEMHEMNIKAQMLCGQALLQLGKSEKVLSFIENGIKRLTRAYSLCSSQNKRAFEKDILTYLNRGKKLLWFKKKEVEGIEKNELVAMIEKLEENNKNSLETQKRSNLEQLKSILFEKTPENLIPDFMIDPISKKLIKEPIIVPSGVSYERETLEAFMNINGSIDPTSRYCISRMYISKANIFPNLTLKRIIEEFIEQ